MNFACGSGNTSVVHHCKLGAATPGQWSAANACVCPLGGVYVCKGFVLVGATVS